MFKRRQGVTPDMTLGETLTLPSDTSMGVNKMLETSIDDISASYLVVFLLNIITVTTCMFRNHVPV